MEQQPISSQVKINKTQTTLTLTTTDGKLRWNDGSRERCITIEREVLGFGIEEKEGFLVRVKALVEKESGSCIIRGGGIDKGGGKGIRKREDFLFQFFDEDSFKIFCQKFREFLDSLDRPKRLLVIVNPFGGKRIALKIYNDEVKPLLDAADIEYTMQETQYQLHAKEIVRSLDLSRYDGVVCVSGDGILVEVVNGLLERKDWDTAIKMPLGIVLAGLLLY
ncbi:hypothetical protein IFM89_015383 [Coptis chinensis]|uniref:DAGKc domain-containing protein n=1 Tax=Coptis chinensis TaxID=261450 RepID=A0A835IAX7_9MAGN|nr:hypothetical protein IFM89_015383 [Coptis chinensis]